jgi:hypothetical protein
MIRSWLTSPRRSGTWRAARIGLIVVVVAGVTAPVAAADVRITRAELNGTQLRLEGAAIANRTITVNGAALGTSDSAGNFKIQRDPFAKPSDCRVSVNDGSATAATATLSGCTVSTTTQSGATSLSSVTVNPTDVVGGNASTGTVRLTAAAPSGGFTVALSSDNTTAATVPASVTVPAGSTTASFPISTNVLGNSQSALIIGTASTVTTYGIITVWTEFAFSHGSISIVPGGNGSGVITSQPTGINCTITNGNGSGACSAFFPVGTVVRLDARAAAGSQFLGWRGLPGCADPSKITVARGTNITCQPGFGLR